MPVLRGIEESIAIAIGIEVVARDREVVGAEGVRPVPDAEEVDAIGLDGVAGDPGLSVGDGVVVGACDLRSLGVEDAEVELSLVEVGGDGDVDQAAQLGRKPMNVGRIGALHAGSDVVGTAGHVGGRVVAEVVIPLTVDHTGVEPGLVDREIVLATGDAHAAAAGAEDADRIGTAHGCRPLEGPVLAVGDLVIARAHHGGSERLVELKVDAAVVEVGVDGDRDALARDEIDGIPLLAALVLDLERGVEERHREGTRLVDGPREIGCRVLRGDQGTVA